MATPTDKLIAGAALGAHEEPSIASEVYEEVMRAAGAEGMQPFGGDAVAPAAASPPKKKRRQYKSEEERRMARILKNRRTAEESRQRRLKRVKELEEFVDLHSARESKREEVLRDLRAQLQTQIRVSEALRQVIAQKDLDLEQRDLDITRLKSLQNAAAPSTSKALV